MAGVAGVILCELWAAYTHTRAIPANQAVCGNFINPRHLFRTCTR